jgi:DNA-binding transcriptional LysR family regulator
MASSLSLGFDDLACFVAVAESGGFTAAGKQLGVRKATLSRHIQQLEAQLGAQLFVRTTRAVRLTDDGRTYLEHARYAVDAARAAARAIDESRDRPTGVLRVTTTPFFGDVAMAPVFLEYLRLYPEVSVDLDLTAENADLIAGGFDVAIRFGPLAVSGLVSRRLGAERIGCFASPAYLKRRGTPTTPHDLTAHDTIWRSPASATASWPFQRQGRRFFVELKPRLLTTSFQLIAQAVREGHGIARIPELLVRHAIDAGDVVPVLAQWAGPAIAIHVVMPRRSPLPARTRAFVDLLVAATVGGTLAQLVSGAPGGEHSLA